MARFWTYFEGRANMISWLIRYGVWREKGGVKDYTQISGLST